MASHRTTDSPFSREGDEGCPKVQMTKCAMDVTKGGEPISSLLGARPITQAVSADVGRSQQFWHWHLSPSTSVSQVNLPLAPRTHSLHCCKPLPISSLNRLSWPSSYFELLYPVYTLNTTLDCPPPHLLMRLHWPFASYMPLKLLWPSHQYVDQMMSLVPFLAWHFKGFPIALGGLPFFTRLVTVFHPAMSFPQLTLAISYNHRAFAHAALHTVQSFPYCVSFSGCPPRLSASTKIPPVYSL